MQEAVPMGDETAVAEQAQQFSEKLVEMAEQLVNLSILEANELVEIFREKYGIEPAAAAPVAMVAGAGAGAAAEEEEEEASSFKVVLKGFGDNKIQVIKAVRAVTSLALKEAKAVVEEAPSTIKEGLAKEEAEEVANSLRESGAEVDVQPE
jgi:large subunit ribosomal protein L7/L12